MNKLALIIPLHKFDSEDRDYFQKCLESIDKQSDKSYDLYIATFPKYKKAINVANSFDLTIKFLDVPELLSEVVPNYYEIVFFAVHTVKNPYLSIVQFDDVLNNTYVENAIKYSDSYPETSVFLPLILEFDGEEFTRSTNEPIWNLNFSEKHGYLDFESLKKYNIFSFVGAVYKSTVFENEMKLSLKKYAEYEFFLRLLYKTHEVMVIPKFMIRHTVNRKNSLSEQYKDMDKMEDLFYLDLAKKEYFFDNDRNILYQPN